ncbi:anaerobic ribonucleoside-triphosphate reductase activating protein [Parabacteroides merdae]|uniref:anaerobic ribonucleoside-triphosphate reductase activating protein n=1 Tax=Parabacteroides merdae TaxID=46503 RepID=UPI001C00E669|nr:anaerobic ribonucleoside-triphosphate reductase activating protein [Parabacteroides merdae]MBT9638200.1 anaerobic ribonucleoside-triphosphate reductase activating protein [Parabacteroides merdae]
MLKWTDYDIVFQEIPGEVSLAISISNCPNRCRGCHSPHLFKDIGTPLNQNALLKILQDYGEEITCICFMGGDSSPKEINELAYFIHKQTKGQIKVGWYSGKNELAKEISLCNFEYIKLGNYIEELGGLKSPRSNQRMYKISDSKMEDITYIFRK